VPVPGRRIPALWHQLRPAPTPIGTGSAAGAVTASGPRTVIRKLAAGHSACALIRLGKPDFRQTTRRPIKARLSGGVVSP
jgi:hypothetical protein